MKPFTFSLVCGLRSSPKNQFLLWSIFLVAFAPAGTIVLKAILNTGEQKLLISTNAAYEKRNPTPQTGSRAKRQSDIFLFQYPPGRICLKFALGPFVGLYLH